MYISLVPGMTLLLSVIQTLPIGFRSGPFYKLSVNSVLDVSLGSLPCVQVVTI